MFDCFSAATAALTLSSFPCQNPREADPMTKVQAELDETKIILVSEAEGARKLKKICWAQAHSHYQPMRHPLKIAGVDPMGYQESNPGQQYARLCYRSSP